MGQTGPQETPGPVLQHCLLPASKSAFLLAKLPACLPGLFQSAALLLVCLINLLQKSCSVPCYKQHKGQCVAKIDPVPQPAKTDASWDARREESVNAEGSLWPVDDILTEDDKGDKVPLHKLQLLSESEELKGILLNPHLRQLLLNVDRAQDKSAALKKYMQEPLFVEFSDCCLRTVEPPEKENELPD